MFVNASQQDAQKYMVSKEHPTIPPTKKKKMIHGDSLKG